MTSSSFKRQMPGQAYDYLPPEPAKREIRPNRTDDIADAEFVVIERSRPETVRSRAFNDNRSRVKVQTPPAGLARSVASSGEAWLQRASTRSFAALVVAACILVFGLSGGFAGFSRADVVSDSAPLHFSHVTTPPRDANGMRVLVINGIVDNVSRVTQVVRPIRADLLVGEQLTASVIINPPADAIYSGQSRGFSTKMQYAGGKIPEVRLSFVP
ncbi:hypothetical protein ASE04_00530 [Rhizobium sp. Root708]|uniref:hypothetical protein n=1 Tax=Rhizobium sp. Root708 TaxID=1736592 RepID=UPI0006FE074E|nr:hypothetical protein [Rhizobium sp. Root708]KRB63031.1 hypothetical protein ASE04_00530 [Rhizobium sp. Root708]